MIEPCLDYYDKAKNPRSGELSAGLTSFGYDLRLSDKDFWIFRGPTCGLIDPKSFDKSVMQRVALHTDDTGSFFLLPSHSYGLGVAVERLVMPADVMGVCLGKSTYARCGIIANVTPAEPGWEGHLTLEFSNSSDLPCKLYANEGVVQMLFFQGNTCDITYKDRKGKYQNQDEEVVLPKVK